MIKLNNIKKIDNELNVSFKKNVDIVYSDLHLDLKTEYTTQNQLYHTLNHKDLVLDYNEEAIKNSLNTLFTTLPGQKLLNPEYGLNLAQFLFYPINNNYAENIGKTIYAGIKLYEPRITVSNINVYANIDDMSYEINITYTIPLFNDTNTNKKFKFLGILNKTGFIINK